MTFRYESDSFEKTEALGCAVAGHIKKGSLIALDGPLGAGKTAFIRGLARGLGYTGRVTSPTFSLVNEYLADNGEPTLFHFDLYRISREDLFDIGWYDCLESGVPCAVEWAEIAQDELPEDAVYVKITVTGESRREISITGLPEIR